MLILRPRDIRPSEITDEGLFWSRRRFVGAAAATLAAAIPPLPSALLPAARDDEKLTPFDDITTYNNFYEFGLDKSDPSRHAHTLRPRPWTVAVDGEVHKPKTFDVDELIRRFPAQERVYRLRCVEAWSMVIPWLGFPLGDLLSAVEPTSHAKFVAFQTLHDPEQMRGQRTGVLPWPYVEGLRLDEARHPLSLLVHGLYGKPLPNQNGAPIRVVVPWKYGFKSIKSIVRIRLVDRQPRTAWSTSNPREYGFYSNVNPDVAHPRWSQVRERRLPQLFATTRTRPFNGYGDQVASMYAGMDLKKFF